jgi:hypothetical protein
MFVDPADMWVDDLCGPGFVGEPSSLREDLSSLILSALGETGLPTDPHQLFSF